MSWLGERSMTFDPCEHWALSSSKNEAGVFIKSPCWLEAGLTFSTPAFTSISTSLIAVCRVHVGSRNNSLFSQPCYCTTTTTTTTITTTTTTTTTTTENNQQRPRCKSLSSLVIFPGQVVWGAIWKHTEQAPRSKLVRILCVSLCFLLGFCPEFPWK